MLLFLPEVSLFPFSDRLGGRKSVSDDYFIKTEISNTN